MMGDTVLHRFPYVPWVCHCRQNSVRILWNGVLGSLGSSVGLGNVDFDTKPQIARLVVASTNLQRAMSTDSL